MHYSFHVEDVRYVLTLYTHTRVAFIQSMCCIVLNVNILFFIPSLSLECRFPKKRWKQSIFFNLHDDS